MTASFGDIGEARAAPALAGEGGFRWGAAGRRTGIPAALATMLFLEPEEVAAMAGPPSDARFWEGVLP